MIIKPIKGYEELYEVSDSGKIFACEKKVKRKNHNKDFIFIHKRKELKLQANNANYLHVGLHKNGKQKTYRVNRLVAEAFISNPLNLPLVLHKDDNKENNSDWNLEWGTQKRNIKQMLDRNRAYRKGENAHFVKLTEKEVLEIRRLYATGKYIQEILANQFNVTRRTIGDVTGRRSWNHI